MQEIPIVIINYKDYARRYLAACVASLRRVTDVPWKLIIIDNETSDETRSYITSAAPEAEVVPYKENLGYSAYSRLVPELIARGYPYVLIANMDIEVDAGFLKPLIDVMERDDSVGAAQSRLMLYQEAGAVNSVGNIIHYLGFGYSLGGYRRWEEVQAGYAEPRQICYASGACMLVRASAVQETGLFDSDFFMYHEDLDFGWKLLLNGKKSMLAPDSVVYHKYEFARSSRQYYWMERNRFICLFKNYRLATLALIVPMLAVMEIGLLAFAAFRGFLREKLRVYAYFFRPAAWKRILRGRREVARLRRVGDRAVLRWFTATIDAQQIDNPLVRYIANPVCAAWFFIVKLLVWW